MSEDIRHSADDWDLHLEAVAFSYRINIQASTKHSLFELLYWVCPRLPCDLAPNADVVVDWTQPNEATVRSIVNRSNDVFEKTTQLRGDAKSNTDVAQAKQKKNDTT